MIHIDFNPNGDSRTLTHEPNKQEIIEARKIHKNNIKKVLDECSSILEIKGRDHDHTVDEFMDEFCDLIIGAYKNNINFVESSWWEKHIKEERHHLEAFFHEDSNLFDLIECIADRVVASKERGQKAGELKLSKDQVYEAYINTIKYIENICK